MDNWKGRSTGMICASCRFYVEEVPDEGCTVLGRCRRHAPTMGGFPVVLPVVFPTDWCGDHKLDENKM